MHVIDVWVAINAAVCRGRISEMKRLMDEGHDVNSRSAGMSGPDKHRERWRVEAAGEYPSPSRVCLCVIGIGTWMVVRRFTMRVGSPGGCGWSSGSSNTAHSHRYVRLHTHTHPSSTHHTTRHADSHTE